YMYGLMEDQPYAGLMQQQLIAQIEEARPKYLVLAKVWTSWLHPLDSRPQLEQWIGRYLPQYYDPVGMVEIFQDQPAHYQWSEQASLQAPTTENYLVVFRRKEIGDGVAAQHLPGVTP
ncbi:MAG TPA: hypothetical protein VMW19_08500, partial [Myxococcota bacterium]|nr:hypothetical protein [Myxococcota bacterium]